MLIANCINKLDIDVNLVAWQNEFCAFNRLALADGLGRDIKLRDGNVASRILPVAIHQLDSDDLSLIENELQSKLRPIDFIFRSPGVNRPLMPDDSRHGNTQSLFYRDQINKVANAIKQIIQAINRIDVLVNTDIFFEGAFKFLTKVMDEIRYPPITRNGRISLRGRIKCASIVLMPVRDKNIIFITRNNGWHNLPNIPS